MPQKYITVWRIMKHRGDKARLFLFIFAVVEFIVLVVVGGIVQSQRDTIQAVRSTLYDYAITVENYKEQIDARDIFYQDRIKRLGDAANDQYDERYLLDRD